MNSELLDALPDPRVLQSNSVAIVTPACVLIRTPRLTGQNVIAIEDIRDVRRLRTSYPGLLVIAAALWLIAAAAYSSKQGDGAAIPMAVIGGIFVLLFLGSRRAAVVFYLENETIETAPGSSRDAAAIIRAVRKLQAAREIQARL